MKKIVVIVVLLGGAALASWLFQKDPGPQVLAQPIAFSHRVHAGDYGIHCLYCHTTASRSAVASVPSVQTCNECHRLVNRDRPEIAKVLRYWNDREPIPWARVHSLPPHVYFSHQQHVRAGVSCQTCHGEVERSEWVVQVAPLTMGWCVDCHRQRNAPLECSTCHK